MALTEKASTNPPAIIHHDAREHIAFLLGETVYAPLRLLLPLTFGTSVMLGFGLGLALGVITDSLPYYVVKETFLAAVGGLTGPPIVTLLRRVYLALRHRTSASRPVSYLLYYFSGALAGCLMMGIAFFYPSHLPLGWWLALYPLGAAGLFPILGLFADYLHEQRDETRRTKEIFGKYVSESIAQRILDAHAAISLEGEKRQATVLISDIRGFTRMIKELGPEEVVHTLNDYFARMIDIIFQDEGTVNKFIGDAIVVLYGAPLAIGDENMRAIHTAYVMQRELRALNETRAAVNKPPLHIGIGIDVGEVVVGNIGSPRRLEYTAIGAPVNTSYYLASLAPADTIYITENVYRAVSAQVSVTQREHIALKGGSGEIDVYVLDEHAPVSFDAHAPAPALTSTLAHV